MPEPDLEEMQKKLRDYRPFSATFTQATNLESLLRMINGQFLTASREANAQNRVLARCPSSLAADCHPGHRQSRRRAIRPLPALTLSSAAAKKPKSKSTSPSNEGRIYLVTARAINEESNAEAVQRLRALVVQTQREVSGLNIGITGEPVLELDEMAQSQKDTTVATGIALVFGPLIFIYGYHETGRPIKATLCLLVGLAYTLASPPLAIGHLNILTITFCPMLIGLAIDFGVHLISRYEEELRHGQTRQEALEKALVFTGLGVFTGCLTTAGAFLAMTVTDFKGIQEMGVICGGGLIISLVPMMTMLPALLLHGRQNIIDHDKGLSLERREKIERLWLARPRLVLIIIAAACILARPFRRAKCISITTCSTCRARVCPPWCLRRNSSIRRRNRSSSALSSPIR